MELNLLAYRLMHLNVSIYDAKKCKTFSLFPDEAVPLLCRAQLPVYVFVDLPYWTLQIATDNLPNTLVTYRVLQTVRMDFNKHLSNIL